METGTRRSFEEDMEQLENLVARLEKGDMPLDEAFDAYEKGVELLGGLRAQLKAGEARIMELTKKGEIIPFREGES